MMDRGNLVAEEDVMTKLAAIKTDKILHFYQPAVKCILSHKFLRDGASWRNYLRPHGLKFRHLSQVCLSYSSDLSGNSANVLKLSQLSRHLSN